MGDNRSLNQGIRFMRNKNIFTSKEDALAKINLIVQKVGQPLAHLYRDPDNKVKMFLTIGLIDDASGPTSYQIIANDVELKELAHYTNAEPLVTGLGGLKAGQTFNDVSYEQMFTDLLYPYIEPLIYISTSVASGVKELGTTLTGNIVTATTTKKSKQIKGVKFFLNNSEILNVATPKPLGGTETYNSINIVGNTTFLAKVSDDLINWVSSGSISYTFIHPAYIGKVAASVSVPTQNDVKALTKKVQTPGNISNAFTLSNERMCLAVPTGWTISSIIDPNGFNIIDSFTKQELTVQCLNGDNISYNVYISEPTSQTGFTVTFNK